MTSIVASMLEISFVLWRGVGKCVIRGRRTIENRVLLQLLCILCGSVSKRQQMTLKKQLRPLPTDSAKPLERLLFHGTMSETAVKGICRQNFDWRLNGANDVLYGRGAYFALNANFSDRYANAQTKRLNWMFLARVLVGRTAVGHRNMVRPPPLDPARPDGDLYDCCINAPETIFVIFDSDQMYPEFVISYESKTA
jgi:Poly(ADP-ribose) polymerase catalytic domain